MLVDEVAEEIRRVVRRAELERIRAVGQLIVERCFDGSVAAWRERRNNKNNAVQRLARSAGCPLSRSALNQAVGIYAVTLAVPSVMNLAHVEASHLAAVLTLTPTEQERWLVEAEARGWTPAQLREAVRTQRRVQGERRGLPRATEQGRALAATRSSLQLLESSLGALTAAQLDPNAQSTLAELSSRIAAVRRRLGAESAPVRSESHLSGTWRAVGGSGSTDEHRSADDETSKAS